MSRIKKIGCGICKETFDTFLGQTRTFELRFDKLHKLRKMPEADWMKNR